MCKDMSSYASMIQRPPSTDDMEDERSVKSAMVMIVVITITITQSRQRVALLPCTHKSV